jgi:hypothetical protein
VNNWPTLRDEYLAWLRSFPMLTQLARPGSSPELDASADAPVHPDTTFWSARTHEAQAKSRRHLTDAQIDAIINDVAAAIDEDLLRFDPLIAYFARFLPDGDPDRIQLERDAAHALKRDLAWAAIQQATGEPAFFTSLLPLYDRGRWPCGWRGPYPTGHPLFL